MELKLEYRRTTANDTLFKSHLYGIEINMFVYKVTTIKLFKSHLYGIEIFERLYEWSHNIGLNRTFMELKFVDEDEIEI